MTMTKPNRHPAGVPTGGQFAPSQRAAAGLSLPRATEYSPAAAELLHKHVASLQMRSDRLKRAEVCSHLCDLGISSLRLDLIGPGEVEIESVMDTDGREVVDDSRYHRAAEVAADYPMPTENGMDVDVLAGVEDLRPAFFDFHSSLAVIPGQVA